MKRNNRSKFYSAIALILVFCFAVVGCTPSSAQADGGKGTIRMGSKDFTESIVLAEVYALALEDAGYKVERTFNIASAVAHTSLVNDEIDVYPEYTGTGLIAVLGHDPVTDPAEVYRIVSEEYLSKFNLVWLEPTAANDGQGIVITTEAAERYGIKTLSDLQANASNIRFASQGEFDLREDGLPGLEAVYGPFEFASIQVFSNALKYDVLQNGEADAAPAYTTEGQLTQPQFTLLEDDKQAWPPYHITPVMRKSVYDANPEAVEVLNAVGKTLDTPTVTALNAKVDVDKREYDDVAKEYYDSIRDTIQIG